MEVRTAEGWCAKMRSSFVDLGAVCSLCETVSKPQEVMTPAGKQNAPNCFGCLCVLIFFFVHLATLLCFWICFWLFAYPFIWFFCSKKDQSAPVPVSSAEKVEEANPEVIVLNTV
jgi:hypothetical protein